MLGLFVVVTQVQGTAAEPSEEARSRVDAERLRIALVLDEPTVGLDPEQRLRFREMISQAGEGRTVVMSSHQTEDITALCTRIAVIHQGRARFAGTPTELTAQAAGRVWTDTQRSPAALAAWRTGDGTHAGGRPRRRFQYCYALFSASGFSAEAEAFAIAHQISLVDLATPSFPGS